MLRFQQSPDEVFQAILSEAIDFIGDEIQSGVKDGENPEYLSCLLPHAERVFDDTTALQTLTQLKACSESPDLYKPSDYHWMLLYDALKWYRDILHDLPDGHVVYEKYGIKDIDFDALTYYYFWDTDFLLNADDVMGLSLEQREGLGLSPEAFGLTQGLRPHPEELKLKRVDSPDIDSTEKWQVIPAADSRYYRKGVASYPYEVEEDDQEGET